MRLGNCVEATREEMRKALGAGDSLVLYPGGLRETPGLYPQAQRGDPYYFYGRDTFVPMAAVRGVPIVVVWCDGERDTYRTWFPLPSISQWLASTRARFPWPMLSFGRWYSFLPRSVPLVLYVSEPIETEGRPISLVKAEIAARRLEMIELARRAASAKKA
jgi:hypothetical protein